MDYKTITIDSYNKNTKEFAKKFKTLTSLQRRYEFKRFISLLSGKKVLDLGCGAGDHAAYFKENGLTVTAIDLSDEMVILCKKKKINCKKMDIENITFKEKTFHGIWAVTSLLHIKKKNIRKVIKELHRILKNEGILYICLKEGEGEKMIKDKNNTTKRFFAFYKEEELLNKTKDYFEIIEKRKTQVKNTLFLELFLRKITQKD